MGKTDKYVVREDKKWRMSANIGTHVYNDRKRRERR